MAAALVAAAVLAGCISYAPPERVVHVPEGLPSHDCPTPACEPGPQERLLVVRVTDADHGAALADAPVVVLPSGGTGEVRAMARTADDGSARFVVGADRFLVAASAAGSTTETRSVAAGDADTTVPVPVYDDARTLRVERTMDPAVGVVTDGRMDRFEVAFDEDPELDLAYKQRLRSLDYALVWHNDATSQQADLHAVLHAPGADEWRRSTDRDDTLEQGERRETATVAPRDAYYIRAELGDGGLWVETHTNRAAVGVLEVHAEHEFKMRFRGSDVLLVGEP